jgi:N-acetylglucosamine-6-phosphate deacetylase
LLKDGLIEGIGEPTISHGRIRVIDVTDLYVAPGFIDLQVNGGAGQNFEGATSVEIRRIVDFHVSHGTTALLPTTVTAPVASVRLTIDRVKRANHPAILGMHIEGPFISEEHKGAQNPRYILEPAVDGFRELIEGYEDFVRVVTLAPELKGADGVVAEIKNIGAVPSLGHSDATYVETLNALDQGVALFTHVFNAMCGFQHRKPGAVGAALDSDAMVELIADGIHVHPAAIRVLLKAKGIDEICLVTDSISATGLEDGKYSLGGLDVFVQDGEARLSDGTLAGSTLTMDKAVKNFMEFTGVSLSEAVEAASLNPARVLEMDDRKGSLEIGKDADIVIFDANLNVCYTIIAGEIVYAGEGELHKN